MVILIGRIRLRIGSFLLWIWTWMIALIWNRGPFKHFSLIFFSDHLLRKNIFYSGFDVYQYEISISSPYPVLLMCLHLWTINTKMFSVCVCLFVGEAIYRIKSSYAITNLLIVCQRWHHFDFDRQKNEVKPIGGKTRWWRKKQSLKATRGEAENGQKRRKVSEE